MKRKSTVASALALFGLSAILAAQPSVELSDPNSEASRRLRDEMASPTTDWKGYIPVTAEDRKRKTVNIRFVVWDGEDGLPRLREAMNDFEKHYPWIKVKLEAVTNNQQEKLMNQVAGNCAPDVAMLDFNGFRRFASRGALYNLNEFIEKTPGFDLKAYYKPIVDAHSYQGNLYVLPRDIAPMGIIYYNKKIFREAGIPFPDGSWTWDYEPRPELREKCFTWVMQQLTKKDRNGKVSQYGYASGWPGLLLEMLIYSQGFRPWDDREEPRKATFNDPILIKSLEFMQRLMLKEKWVPSPNDLRTAMNTSAHLLFAQGRLAMYQVGIWEVPGFRKEIVKGKPGYFDWDIALAPGFKDGTRGCPTGGSGYAILKQSKHPWEAWLAAMWMAGPPGMQAMAKAGIAQPAIRAMALQEPWIPGPNTPADQQVPASRIVTDHAVPYVVFPPSWENWKEMGDMFSGTMDSLILGLKDAKTETDIVTKRAQRRLDVLRKEQALPRANWTVGGAVAGLIFLGGLAWIYWPERKFRRTAKEKRENWTAYAFISPWLIGLIALTLGPMLFSLLVSFMDWDSIRPARFRGIENYVEMTTQDPWFWKSLLVTTLYTIFSVPLGLAISLALALLLNTKVRGMPIYRTLYYLPSLASGVAATLIWRRVFQPEGGLLNTLIYGADGQGNFLGLASLLAPLSPPGQPVNWLGNESTALSAMVLMSTWGAGGAMIILLAGLQGVPQHYYEAATVDGAGPWRKFRAITLPMVSPALFFCLITGFIGSFQVFTQSFVVNNGATGAPNGATLFFMLHIYNNAFMNMRMGYASALAWVMFFVVLIFTVAQMRLTKYVYYEGDAR